MAAKVKSRPVRRRQHVVRRAADSAERAYAAIRQWVIEFKLKPEQHVNELKLAETLSLSRTPVREALNRLASEGFVVFSPNRGFFCRALDVSDLVAVCELRSILERGSFELACQRASNAAIAALAHFWSGTITRVRQRDPDEMLGLDEAFHRRLAELSGNSEIVRRITAIHARNRFVYRVSLDQAEMRRMAEHNRIIAALKARNAELGTRILAQHISLSVEDARRLLKETLFRLYVTEQVASGRRAA